MSLKIDTDAVDGVLLADGWHEVHDRSFTVDAYEFMDGGQLVGGSGTGFVFRSGEEYLLGPLSAILAVSME